VATPNQIFARKVAELIRQARALEPRVQREVIALLEEARKRIVGELAGLDPASFTAAQRAELKRSIDRALADFSRQAGSRVTALQEQSFRLGQQMVDGPAGAVGFSPLGRVSTDTLKIAQGYTADLITGLSTDAAAKVNAAIQRAFLGGQSMTEIISQIGRAVGGREFTGLFSEVGRRATTIAVNEILRVHSIAAQARLEDLAERLPGAKKQWHWVNVGQVPRQTHRDIDGQVKEVDEPFEVPDPVDGVVEELMYPRDPGGSPSNTINCHCLVKPFFDEEMLAPSTGQQNVLRDLGIEITVSPG
jgi:hypothetical protein